MSQSDPQTPPPEAELPPEAAHFISRARRSFGVSIAILLLGFIAIVGALVYRATRDGGGPETRYAVESIGLPSGAEVVSAVLAEGMVTLTFKLGDTTEIRLLDGKTGATLRQIAVTDE